MDSLKDVQIQGEGIVNKASFLNKKDYTKAMNFYNECIRDPLLRNEFEILFKHDDKFKDKGLYVLVFEYRNKVFQKSRDRAIKRRKELKQIDFEEAKGYSHDLETYYNAALLEMAKERKEVHKQGELILEKIRNLKAQIEALNSRFDTRWDPLIKFKQSQTTEVELMRSNAMLGLMEIDEKKEPGKAAELNNALTDDSAQQKREEVKKEWLTKKENIDWLKSVAHVDGKKSYKLTTEEELEILNELGLNFLKTSAEQMVESAEASFSQL